MASFCVRHVDSTLLTLRTTMLHTTSSGFVSLYSTGREQASVSTMTGDGAFLLCGCVGAFISCFE